MRNFTFSDDREWDIFLKHLVTGAMSGTVSRSLTAPLDRIKTFQQVSENYVSSKDLVKQMYHEGGILSFWRGNWLNVIKNAPKIAIRFAVYNETKRLIVHKSDEPLTTGQRFFSGCVAGCISQACTYPLEVLKVRLSLRQTGRYKGILDAIRKIYQTEGIRSFTRGFMPAMLAVIPYSGLDLAGYEKMKQVWFARKKAKLNFLELFVIASCSCILAQVTTYPIMLIAVRLQADERDVDQHRTSIKRMLRKIWKKEGIFGFYRGLRLNLLKFIPGMGITYVTYEECNKFFNIRME